MKWRPKIYRKLWAFYQRPLKLMQQKYFAFPNRPRAFTVLINSFVKRWVVHIGTFSTGNQIKVNADIFKGVYVNIPGQGNGLSFKIITAKCAYHTKRQLQCIMMGDIVHEKER